MKKKKTLIHPQTDIKSILPESRRGQDPILFDHGQDWPRRPTRSLIFVLYRGIYICYVVGIMYQSKHKKTKKLDTLRKSCFWEVAVVNPVRG